MNGETSMAEADQSIPYDASTVTEVVTREGCKATARRFLDRAVKALEADDPEHSAAFLHVALIWLEAAVSP